MRVPVKYGRWTNEKEPDRKMEEVILDVKVEVDSDGELLGHSPTEK